jgi:hypothetical protein
LDLDRDGPGDDICTFWEARAAEECTCENGRSSPGLACANVRNALLREGLEELDCICKLDRVAPADRDACRNDLSPAQPRGGWCEIDIDYGCGNPALVADCDDNFGVGLRLVGGAMPSSEDTVLLGACLGVGYEEADLYCHSVVDASVEMIDGSGNLDAADVR